MRLFARVGTILFYLFIFFICKFRNFFLFTNTLHGFTIFKIKITVKPLTLAYHKKGTLIEANVFLSSSIAFIIVIIKNAYNKKDLCYKL